MKTFIEENCTVNLRGREFTSGGAIVTSDYLIAYPAKDGVLNDWHGNKIGTYKVISERKAIFFRQRSWMGEKYYFMRALVNGKRYSLRGFGEGMIAKGKALK